MVLESASALDSTPWHFSTFTANSFQTAQTESDHFSSRFLSGTFVWHGGHDTIFTASVHGREDGKRSGGMQMYQDMPIFTCTIIIYTFRLESFNVHRVHCPCHTAIAQHTAFAQSAYTHLNGKRSREHFTFFFTRIIPSTANHYKCKKGNAVVQINYANDMHQ